MAGEGEVSSVGPAIEVAIRAWVRVFGRRTRIGEAPWLDGPIGGSGVVGPDVYARVARDAGLEVFPSDPDAGLLPDFAALRGPSFDPDAVNPRVRGFYEHTARYRLTVEPEWSPLFLPFVRILVGNVSPRVDQLNLPLTPVDARDLTSEIIRLGSREDVRPTVTGWLRRVGPHGRVMYAGFYSIATPPRARGPCVKTVFPLPLGNATVLLRPSAGKDGSLWLVSAGAGFGDTGFYRTAVVGDFRLVRYIPAFRETFHIFPRGEGLRTDHSFRFFTLDVLSLRYTISGP